VSRAGRVPRARGREQGFSLIEVLVAIALFSIMLALTGMLLSSFRMNRASRVSLDVNQTVNAYLDSAYSTWQNALTYRVGTLPNPPALPGHTWTLTRETVDPQSGTPSNTSTVTQPGTVGNYDHDVPLKRVTLSYTGPKGSYAGTLEVGRP